MAEMSQAINMLVANSPNRATPSSTTTATTTTPSQPSTALNAPNRSLPTFVPTQAPASVTRMEWVVCCMYQRPRAPNRLCVAFSIFEIRSNLATSATKRAVQ
jgi:hypothetical protein